MASNGPPAIDVADYPSSSSSKTHHVRISRVDGKLYCTCKGWGFKKSCRHTRDTTKEQILAALEATCEAGVLGL